MAHYSWLKSHAPKFVASRQSKQEHALPGFQGPVGKNENVQREGQSARSAAQGGVGTGVHFSTDSAGSPLTKNASRFL
jgi:hypothetical protein